MVLREEKIGFSYAVLDRYIRTGEIDDLNIKEKIEKMHQANLHKLRLMPSYKRKIIGKNWFNYR